jgi:hypothetical protein
MRKLLWFLLLVPSPLWWADSAAAQEGTTDLVYSRFRVFKIPFTTGPGQQRLKQLQLFVSTDRGKTWQPSATAHPDHKYFQFMTDHDGVFWFTVQTLDVEGMLYPKALEGAQPSLKVLVDTVAPVVKLEALSPRDNEVGVAWKIQEEHFEPSLPDAVRLEFRSFGSAVWHPVKVNPAAGEHYWNPGESGPLEVRVRARDRAGNLGEATTTVQRGSGGTINPGKVNDPSDSDPPPAKTPAFLPKPGDPKVRMVNSKKISLNYEVKDQGPSGISAVELWYTQDGRSWQKYPKQQPGDKKEGTQVYEVTVHDEGLYGFTLLARSGVGLGERPPQIGDQPQVWVEVDLTKPVVQLHDVSVGQGADKGKLTITWNAKDRNLSTKPITISYAEEAGGTWTTIAAQLANTGRHVWTMPATVPYQFLIRIEAVDRAGNIGEAVTPNLVKVDLSQPKVKILDVGPAGK